MIAVNRMLSRIVVFVVNVAVRDVRLAVVGHVAGAFANDLIAGIAVAAFGQIHFRPARSAQPIWRIDRFGWTDAAIARAIIVRRLIARLAAVRLSVAFSAPRAATAALLPRLLIRTLPLSLPLPLALTLPLPLALTISLPLLPLLTL